MRIGEENVYAVEWICGMRREKEKEAVDGGEVLRLEFDGDENMGDSEASEGEGEWMGLSD